MERMGKNVNFGVFPVNQFAVEPDFFGFDHCHGSSSGIVYVIITFVQ
jgi:hypothetical protein